MSNSLNPLVLDSSRRELPSFLQNFKPAKLLMALDDKSGFEKNARTLNEIGDGRHTNGAYTREVALRVNYHLGHNNRNVREAAERAKNRIIKDGPAGLNLQLCFKGPRPL